ncbi:MAG: TonB family protein [Candidatus Obscuribacter sp.]|nr:TonB family protein [Candidatus Obscuribacter sp.]
MFSTSTILCLSVAIFQDSVATAFPNSSARDVTPERKAKDVFMKEVAKSFNKVWRPPVSEQTYPPVIVQFKVDRSGKISNAKVIQSSGLAEFDKRALLVLENAEPIPLPPLMPDTVECEYSFHILWKAPKLTHYDADDVVWADQIKAQEENSASIKRTEAAGAMLEKAYQLMASANKKQVERLNYVTTVLCPSGRNTWKDFENAITTGSNEIIMSINTAKEARKMYELENNTQGIEKVDVFINRVKKAVSLL